MAILIHIVEATEDSLKHSFVNDLKFEKLWGNTHLLLTSLRES